MAIWNELYDGDLNISIGSTRITGDGHGVTVIAQDFLNGLGNASTSSVSSAEAAWLQLAFTRPATGTEPALTTDAQDFIGPLTPATPVPEPAAGMLLGMGIASLAAFRSRKSFLRRS